MPKFGDRQGQLLGPAWRIEVTDDGSDLSAPVLTGEPHSSDGHGLLLMQSLADQWGYLRGAAGTTVWFCLRPQPAD